MTTTTHEPGPGIAPVWGNGPAGPVGLAPGAILYYVAPSPDSVWTDRRWGGEKVLWAVDPRVSSLVLVRGRQIDGPREVRFEDPAIPELLLDPAHGDAQPGGWRYYPGYTRLKAPGCYAYQVDTAVSTTSIVFRAVGPVVW